MEFRRAQVELEGDAFALAVLRLLTTTTTTTTTWPQKTKTVMASMHRYLVGEPEAAVEAAVLHLCLARPRVAVAATPSQLTGHRRQRHVPGKGYRKIVLLASAR
jgi:hypothetical protein